MRRGANRIRNVADAEWEAYQEDEDWRCLDGVALGLYALQSKLFDSPTDEWQRLSRGERERYRCRARFVLSYVDPTALEAGRDR
jgi:hypothetical protein